MVTSFRPLSRAPHIDAFRAWGLRPRCFPFARFAGCEHEHFSRHIPDNCQDDDIKKRHDTERIKD